MVTSSTCEGTLRVPDALVQAVTRHAERQADLTGSYLRASGLCPEGEIRLPAAALLELAAVLELGVWEMRGLRTHLDVDLPSYREAAAELAARCMKGPEEFGGEDATPLSVRVLRVWTEHFAWDAPEMLDAEVVFGDAEEDDFVDLLAEFVWAHRNELRHIILAGRQ
jgi:hypothetical protein